MTDPAAECNFLGQLPGTCQRCLLSVAYPRSCNFNFLVQISWCSSFQKASSTHSPQPGIKNSSITLKLVTWKSIFSYINAKIFLRPYSGYVHMTYWFAIWSATYTYDSSRKVQRDGEALQWIIFPWHFSYSLALMSFPTVSSLFFWNLHNCFFQKGLVY